MRPVSTTPLVVALALEAIACSDDEAPPVCANVDLGGPIIVLEQDAQRTSSALGLLDARGCLREVEEPALGQDPVLSDAHGRPFAVLRDEGVVRELSTDALRMGARVPAFAPGEEPPNPHDVDVDPASGRMWITRYDRTSVAVVSASGERGEVEVGHADADGLPEMEAVRVDGDRVAIALQLLDREHESGLFPPTGPGLVVLLAAEPPHDEIGTIPLSGQNPFGRFVPFGDGELAVATPGEHGSVSASDGIDAIEVSTMTARRLASEEDFGGSVIEVAFGGEGEAYAILEGPSPENATWVVAFDPREPARHTILVDSRTSSEPGFVHAGLAVSGCCLVVGDRTRHDPALVFFERKTGRTLARLRPAALPPVALLAVTGGG